MRRSRNKGPRAQIVYNGRSIELLAGTYVIGRAPSCTLVIDERNVSRRHACLRIGEDGASVEDLGSANGVFVNGSRIVEREPLEDGDLVVIGEEKLQLQLDLPSSASAPRRTLPAPPPSSDQEPGSETVESMADDPFLVLAASAERALAAGQVAQAERAIQQRLLEIASDAERRRPSLDERTIDRALTLSLALAEALPSRRWLEYAIDLLTALSRPLSDPLATGLLKAKARVGEIDRARLDAYARAIRRRTSSMHTIRTMTIIEELKSDG
jgi:pSer/pThr/pTyr-binding forkhead associated (FHA) protein